MFIYFTYFQLHEGHKGAILYSYYYNVCIIYLI